MRERGAKFALAAAMSVCVRTVLLLLLTLTPNAVLAQRVPDQADVLAEQGDLAFEAKRYGDALEAFTTAVAFDPRDPTLWYAKGLAAFMLGQGPLAETSLNQALKLNRRFVEASFLLGELQYQAGRVADAIATYEAALVYAPKDRDLLDRLEHWRRDSRFSERLYKSRGSHFRVLFEGPSDDAIARRAVEYLEAAYWQVGGALSAHPTSSITVVLYTIEQFRDITRAPAWAGGLYDGQIRVAVKGALEHPEQLEQLLVHEYVHALVGQLGGRTVPFWLNEGLATALEPGGPEWAASVLARSDGNVPLDQLHQSFTRLHPDDVTQAYAESASAVRRLLQMRGAPALVMLLRDLQRGVRFEAAFHQRMAMRYDDFLIMLRR